MRRIAFVIAVLGNVMLTNVATAAPTIGDAAPAAQSIVQKAYYYHRWHRGWYGPRVGFYGGPRWGYGYGGGGYCYRWRHICADRWGWGGPGFGRCLWRHGC
jgi:hypothetical protein